MEIRLALVWYVCQDSLTKHAPAPMDATGRSGARFWLSYDRLFVLKLISSEDVIEMHRIMQDYHQVINCHFHRFYAE